MVDKLTLEEHTKAEKMASTSRALYKHSPVSLIGGAILVGLGYLLNGDNIFHGNIENIESLLTPNNIYPTLGFISFGFGISGAFKGGLAKLIYRKDADPFLSDAKGKILYNKIFREEIKEIGKNFKNP